MGSRAVFWKRRDLQVSVSLVSAMNHDGWSWTPILIHLVILCQQHPLLGRNEQIDLISNQFLDEFVMESLNAIHHIPSHHEKEDQ